MLSHCAVYCALIVCCSVFPCMWLCYSSTYCRPEVLLTLEPILQYSLLTASQRNLLGCIDQVKMEIKLPLQALSLLSSPSLALSHAHKGKTKMLINCTMWLLRDGDLCFAFAAVIVRQHEGWTPEHKPMIFFPSSPMPLSRNNSICIHRWCICHSCYVLSGSLPKMLCSRHSDSRHSAQNWEDGFPLGRWHFTALLRNVTRLFCKWKLLSLNAATALVTHCFQLHK